MFAVLLSLVPQASGVEDVVTKARTGLDEWVNVQALKWLSHHTSALLAALVLFWLTGWLLRKLLHEGLMKRVVLLLDEVVLLCVFVYFAYELIFQLFIRVRGL